MYGFRHSAEEIPFCEFHECNVKIDTRKNGAQMLAESETPRNTASWITRAAGWWLGGTLFCLAAVLLVAPWHVRTACAQQDFVSREPQIKAAYVYNFGKYVEWPSDMKLMTEGKRPAFFIDVVGESPVLGPLQVITRTKMLADKRIVIRPIRDGDDYRPCHILFIPASQRPQMVESALKKAQGSATLTVGETEEFLQRGGMIRFLTEDNHLRFEINVEAALRANVKISAKLLRLGKIVQPDQVTGR